MIMAKSLYRTLYDAFTYTHEETRERIDNSGVRSKVMIKNLDLNEVVQLADAFDLENGDMLDILIEGMFAEKEVRNG